MHHPRPLPGPHHRGVQRRRRAGLAADGRLLPAGAGRGPGLLAPGGGHRRRTGRARPGFSAALAYYDALRSRRLPAALVQGQRDYFGAHTYRRTDRDGSFHTLWGGDRDEQQA
ncbi:hypothetical protein NKH77_06565 [Streptomyces sp. M19]